MAKINLQTPSVSGNIDLVFLKISWKFNPAVPSIEITIEAFGQVLTHFKLDPSHLTEKVEIDLGFIGEVDLDFTLKATAPRSLHIKGKVRLLGVVTTADVFIPLP